MGSRAQLPPKRMTVAVSYTTVVDDDYRRAIRRFYGRRGLATRAEVERWLYNYGTSMDDDLAIQESSAHDDSSSAVQA